MRTGAVQPGVDLGEAHQTSWKGTEDRDSVSWRVLGNKAEGNGYKLEHEGGQTLDHVAQQSWGVSILGGFSSWLGNSLNNIVYLDLL